jgi:hypothetical protein
MTPAQEYIERIKNFSFFKNGETFTCASMTDALKIQAGTGHQLIAMMMRDGLVTKTSNNPVGQYTSWTGKTLAFSNKWRRKSNSELGIKAYYWFSEQMFTEEKAAMKKIETTITIPKAVARKGKNARPSAAHVDRKKESKKTGKHISC